MFYIAHIVYSAVCFIMRCVWFHVIYHVFYSKFVWSVLYLYHIWSHNFCTRDSILFTLIFVHVLYSIFSILFFVSLFSCVHFVSWSWHDHDYSWIAHELQVRTSLGQRINLVRFQFWDHFWIPQPKLHGAMYLILFVKPKNVLVWPLFSSFLLVFLI